MKHRKPRRHGDHVDRHGATWQQARLHARRMRQRYEEAVESGDPSAVEEASVRLSAAERWEIRSGQRFVQSALATYDRPIPTDALAHAVAHALAGRAA